MSITTDDQLQALQALGRIVAATLEAVAARVSAGITTRELDHHGARLLASHGVHSAPPLVYGFPGALCISVNEEAVHGVPGDRALEDGDIVKLDLTAERDGYYCDAALTVPVGRTSDHTRRLVRCAHDAFWAGAEQARAGARLALIGRAVEHHTERCGFRVLEELCGHGIGRTIHEAPSVPNYYVPQLREVLTEGLVLTIEPIIATGTSRTVLAGDGWTVRTADGSPSAHYEHTLVITKGRPLLLTAA